MPDFLISADQQLFLFLNGRHNSFFDFVMYWSSDRFIWIPYYLFLLFALIRNFGRQTVLLMVLVAAMITLSDQVSSGLVKDAVQRLRPCHDPSLQDRVHLVNGYCGGQFGFFSSHASNSWALVGFLLLVFRRKMKDGGQPFRFMSLKGFGYLLIAYASLISYSRIYLGAHYPGDVLAGFFFGWILSFIFAFIFHQFNSTNSRVKYEIQS